jgi:ABC-2 type transport system ATP-binding protein
MAAMYNDIVEFAELGRFMDQKLKNYSSGMQVRLAFSVAIRANTDILLIDEVLAVGDQSFQEKCFDYFGKIKESGKTVVFVTHDMSNVERFCDRAFVLDKKKEVNGLYTIPEAVSIYNGLNHERAANVAWTRKQGGLHLKNVHLAGSDGKKRETFSQGEELNIEVEIDGELPKEEKITIGLAFHDRDNINMAGPNSLGNGFTTSSKKILYSIKELPFNMGEYRLTVALLDGSGTKYHDLIDKELSFFVNTSQTHAGKVVLNDSWSETK